MWFKNLKIYRLSAAWPLHGDDLENALARQAFHPGDNLEMQSIGWIPPREGGGLASPTTRTEAAMILTRYSDRGLLDELERRHHRINMNIEYSDHCTCFVPWRSSKPMPENYNPCIKDAQDAIPRARRIQLDKRRLGILRAALRGPVAQGR